MADSLVGSSRVALDVFTGNDETIDFADVMDDADLHPSHREPHVAMERKLGIQAPRMI